MSDSLLLANIFIRIGKIKSKFNQLVNYPTVLIFNLNLVTFCNKWCLRSVSDPPFLPLSGNCFVFTASLKLLVKLVQAQGHQSREFTCFKKFLHVANKYNCLWLVNLVRHRKYKSDINYWGSKKWLCNAQFWKALLTLWRMTMGSLPSLFLVSIFMFTFISINISNIRAINYYLRDFSVVNSFIDILKFCRYA